MLSANSRDHGDVVTGLAMQSIGEAIVYLRDPEHKIDLEPIRVEQDLTIECQPVHILDSSE
ncbi:hypothetical protein E2562_028376 [Oryza meyeriana var. granulata]|uniref:Uncharacterized protein n=1 Tax=Oryza meyeriana var. granulata TaxID=110450 RepID=A0A6G1CU70_9ORYZ|nr:hypothetical protein E2562_028376 [Oryza meyeriana var. granulata]